MRHVMLMLKSVKRVLKARWRISTTWEGVGSQKVAADGEEGEGGDGGGGQVVVVTLEAIGLETRGRKCIWGPNVVAGAE